MHTLGLFFCFSIFGTFLFIFTLKQFDRRPDLMMMKLTQLQEFYSNSIDLSISVAKYIVAIQIGLRNLLLYNFEQCTITIEVGK